MCLFMHNVQLTVFGIGKIMIKKYILLCFATIFLLIIYSVFSVYNQYNCQTTHTIISLLEKYTLRYDIDKHSIDYMQNSEDVSSSLYTCAPLIQKVDHFVS